MKHLNRKRVLIASAVMVLISNLALIHFGIIHSDTDTTVWTNSFVQFEMFAAGILLALLRGKHMPSTSQRIFCVAFLPVAWFFAGYAMHIKASGMSCSPARLCVGYAAVAMSCAFFIYALSDLERWPRWFVYLGKISYGLYVFHGPAIHIHSIYKLPALPRLAISLSLTIALAAISYRFFETPFLKKKEKLEIVPSRPVEAA